MMDLTSIINYAAHLFEAALFSLIFPFWSYGESFSIGPDYAFLSFALNNSRYLSLESSALLYGAIPIIPILTLSLSIWYLVNVSLGRGYSPSLVWMRIALALLVSTTTFEFVQFAYNSAGSIYLTLYHSAGIQWNNIYTVTGSNLLRTGSTPDDSLVNLLTLTGYFIGTTVFFGFLSIRIAVLLILIIVLPFLGALSLVPKLERYFLRAMTLCLGMIFVPYLALLDLYLCSIFRIQAIQISLLIGFPIFVSYILMGVYSGSMFTGQQVFSDLTFSSLQDRAFGMFRGSQEFGSGETMMGAVRMLTSITSDHASRWVSVPKEPVPDIWQSMINDELKFRRDI
ncbi:MAG TPA: hypothetical protein VKU79_07480 [Thermoplasmataceae archaeon]|nr:hypothetical protein [Thermoplasmataceae archaeon]